MKFLAILLLLALVAAGLGAWLVYAPFGLATDGNPIYVDIAPGSGTQAMAAQLESAGAVRSRCAFLLLRVFKGGILKAGEYRFDHPAPATEVYARIVRGDVYTIAVTIPEGYNIFDIADAVDKAGLVPHDKFLAAERADTALISDLAPNAASLEGYLFPDTYRFPHHITPEKILSTMVGRFRKIAGQVGLFKQQVKQQADIAGLVLSPVQKLTLASLVEKEVSQDSERPMVAGVFVNRLGKGMPLATDPTIIYTALLNGRWRGTIYASDLKFDSPYNTYLHAGLPPGPICNPGVAALKASLAPAHTDYLYFVADGQGHSVFSATLAQHNQHVQVFRRRAYGAQ